MANNNTVVKWSLLVSVINQIKTRYVDKNTYTADMDKKVNISDFETSPVDWGETINK